MENESPKNQLATKLKEANNVLVTVSTNPTVDQLSAAIGLTLFLTKLKKHATTVFSGQVPSTIDFLKPEETIETNTDSLRDFIISLDKAKADKIRYKVEDTMVKIFITPYRTSINDADLVFSQGDFNVDVVVALGIQKRDDIDQAIMAHGRILHDATVATVNITAGSDIGTLDWTDPKSSSLCEMMVAITDLLKANSLDGQMATALLTGIVAETERFSNEKTSSNTMNASAKLMTAGANQQLVATKLQPPEDEPPATSGNPQNPADNDSDSGAPKDASLDEDGSLRINHHSSIPEADETQGLLSTTTQALPQHQGPADSLPKPWSPDDDTPNQQSPPPDPTSFDVRSAQDLPSNQGQGHPEQDTPKAIQPDNRQMLDSASEPIEQNNDIFGLTASDNDHVQETPTNSKLVTEPPQFGGQLSAAADDSSNETNPLNLPPVSTPPMLSHDKPSAQTYQAPLPQPKPKPNFSGPPEPYTVFEPEPVQKQAIGQNVPSLPKPVDPLPKMPTNLPRAVDSSNLNLPTPPNQPVNAQSTENAQTKPANTGHAFVDMGNKTLDSIEKNVDSPHQDAGKSKLPEQFLRTLDNTTLSGLEEKVDSPHTRLPKPVDKVVADKQVDYHREAESQVVKAMSGTTLDKIEEKVDSPHVHEKASVLVTDTSQNDDELQLNYEAHESEPVTDSDPIEMKTDTKDSNSVAENNPTQAITTPDTSPQTPAKPAVETLTPAQEKVKAVDSQSAQDIAAKESKDKLDEKTAQAKQDAARDAVARAINAGGDGRTSLPPLESMGTVGAVEVTHTDTEESQKQTVPPPVPPPIQPKQHSGPSPHINIDPVDGTLTPLPPNLVPNGDSLPSDQTASVSGEASAPPVPPPMMPSVPAGQARV